MGPEVRSAEAPARISAPRGHILAIPRVPGFRAVFWGAESRCSRTWDYIDSRPPVQLHRQSRSQKHQVASAHSGPSKDPPAPDALRRPVSAKLPVEHPPHRTPSDEVGDHQDGAPVVTVATYNEESGVHKLSDGRQEDRSMAALPTSRLPRIHLSAA